MGKKAKVQIQKAKPEKETESEMLHGLVYPAVISGRKRKRSWQRKKSWQCGRTQYETEVIQLSMNMENKSISVTCKTRKTKTAKVVFLIFVMWWKRVGQDETGQDRDVQGGAGCGQPKSFELLFPCKVFALDTNMWKSFLLNKDAQIFFPSAPRSGILKRGLGKQASFTWG